MSTFSAATLPADFEFHGHSHGNSVPQLNVDYYKLYDAPDFGHGFFDAQSSTVRVELPVEVLYKMRENGVTIRDPVKA